MNEFNSRVLYDQTCLTEDGVNVLSTIYAITWKYPGALTTTSARVRLTCVYSFDNGIMSTHGGTIEKWRNEGWGIIDEYHDDRENFYTAHGFRDRLFKHAQSFLTGVPLEEIDDGYVTTDDSDPQPSGVDDKPAQRNFKVLEYRDKNTAKTKKDKSDKSKSKIKDTDFDWV